MKRARHLGSFPPLARRAALATAAISMGLLLSAGSAAAFEYYCPEDTDGDGISDAPDVKCLHLAGSDGLITMGDGKELYVFGFSNVSGDTADADNIDAILEANQPSPTIVVKENDILRLSVSIMGFLLRPDIPDPHTVHWHGFQQAATVFDGIPDISIAPVDGASLHYFYVAAEPGTFMYHCHVEATEHIQMGMIGNLYVTPAQDDLGDGTLLGSHTHSTGDTYAYNDGDGSTRYDVQKAIQLTDLDGDFHDASLNVQPLPFLDMTGTYFLMNGRSYPDTLDPSPLTNSEGFDSQLLNAKLEVDQGQKLLIRFSNLSTTAFHTVECLGCPMRVVGQDARVLKGPDGTDFSFLANALTIGSGQTADVIIDTSELDRGTYHVYSRSNFTLNNNEERRGGMMTELVVN